MKTQQIVSNLDRIILIIISIVCIGISLFDFLGLLDSLEWLKERILIIVLLTLGLLATHLITQNYLLQKSIGSQEKALKETKDSIIEKLNIGISLNQFSSDIQAIWETQQRWVEKLFTELESLGINGNEMGRDLIKTYLEEKFSQLAKGAYFQNKVNYPWDFTLTAIDSQDGYFIFHPNNLNINSDKSMKEPYNRVLKEKNGEFIWPNGYASEQFRNAFHDEIHFKISKGFINRYTKVIFREIPNYNLIIAFESHINLVYKLPKDSYDEYLQEIDVES